MPENSKRSLLPNGLPVQCIALDYAILHHHKECAIALMLEGGFFQVPESEQVRNGCYALQRTKIILQKAHLGS